MRLVIIMLQMFKYLKGNNSKKNSATKNCSLPSCKEKSDTQDLELYVQMILTRATLVALPFSRFIKMERVKIPVYCISNQVDFFLNLV